LLLNVVISSFQIIKIATQHSNVFVCVCASSMMILIIINENFIQEKEEHRITIQTVLNLFLIITILTKINLCVYKKV